MKLNIFNIIILLGAIQGLMLAGVFLFSKKLNRQSNFFLALLLLSFSMVNLANCLWDMGFVKQTPILQFLPLNWTLLIPFSLYYFIQYLINPVYKIADKEYLLLLPFGIQLAQKLVQLGLFLSNPNQLDEWRYFFNRLVQVLEIIAIIYCIVVFVLSIRKINQFQSQLQNQFADIERRSLAWIKNILIKVALLLALWIVPYVFAMITDTNVNNYMYPLWIGMTVVVYWLGWAMFNRRDLFEFTPPEVLVSKSNEIPLWANTVPATQLESKELPVAWEQHYQKLKSLIENEKLYLDMDLSMSTLAQKMNLSNGYLSQIINQKEGVNFYDYINKYRVEAVTQKLLDPASSHLSIYGIAMDCGFKSKSTFNLVFKKVTGLTPTAYKNSL